MKHGASYYAQYSCRCDVCKEGHRARQANGKAERYAQRVKVYGRMVATNPNVVHGSASTYRNWGCRCRDCTDALRDYNRELKLRRS